MRNEKPLTNQEPEPGVVAPVLDPGMLDPLEAIELDASNNPEPRAHPGEVIPRADGDRLRTGRLAGLSMGAAIWALSWPVLCESVLNSLIGLVDTVISAHLSQAATDAVGGAAYLLWFVGLVVMAIGVGATALISRSVGAGKMAVARAALGQAILLAVIAGVLLAGAMYVVAPFMASIMSMQGEAKADFVLYMRAMCVGMPGATVLFASNACARGAGDSVSPLITMIAVNVLNLAVSWVLAIRLGLGVLGIGLGTSIAQLMGAGLIVWLHSRGSSGVRLSRRWMPPHRVTIFRLFRLGLPNFAETFGMWVVNFGTVLMVGWMGRSALLAHSAEARGESGGYLGAHLLAIRLEGLSFVSGFAMGIAAGALCGQYLGAGLPHMARRAAWRCALIASGIMGVGGVALITLGGVIVARLTEQPAHRELTPTLLLITGCVQIPFALAIVMRSTMQGAGDVKAVMTLTWISQWGLRLPLAYAISGVDIPLPEFVGGGVLPNPFPFRMGLPGLWIGLCSEIVIRCVLYGWRFRSGRWLRARV